MNALDPAAFISSLVDLNATGLRVKLPDGSTANRLPGLKRNRGYATKALQEMLSLAAEKGLRYVEVTDNVASQRTILKAGGVLYEQFMKPEQCVGTPGLRYPIAL